MIIEVSTVGRLLYSGESNSLDFKSEQYRFSDATDDEKSELLKDILGFANAWRSVTAYILIGVREVQGGRAIVEGIETHLHDHHLQQFVNNKTNRPVQFGYAALEIEGKQIGVIHFDSQSRPVYLKSDYGKLKKNEVYVRRGSSTDPSKPASPEELAHMGTGTAAPTKVDVSWVDNETHRSAGTSISRETEVFSLPPAKDIPDFRTELSQYSWQFRSTNEDFIRELADYLYAVRLHTEVRIAVRNVGMTSATDVRVEIEMTSGPEQSITCLEELPTTPRSHDDLFRHSRGLDAILKHREEPGRVTISSIADRWRITCECDSIQPGRMIVSEPFYLGSTRSGPIELAGLVYSNSLPEPTSFTLEITLSAKPETMSAEKLNSWAHDIAR